MYLYWTALALGVAATVAFLIIRVARGGVAGLIAKAAPSVFFILSACMALRVNTTDYGFLIIAGLLVSLLGDLWLDLKWIYQKDRDTYLFTGFYSFLIAQSFYSAAILLHSQWKIWTLLASVGLAALLAGGVLVMEKPMKMHYGRFRLTCFLYTLVLAFSFSSSLFAAITSGATVWIVMVGGIALFFLSDLVLSGMYFGKDKNTPVNVVLNHGLYYAAQFVIASSVLFLK
ncbi:MAG: lysoplasmalogenase [Clostridiales bacterium]|nr:lysoplasmalogenase [Clostridiales bacterium]